MIELNKIYQESNTETLNKMPDDYIDMVLCSPPYLDARDYNGFSWSLEELCPLLKQKMKSGGVCVWVIGDQTKNGSETGDSFRQALHFLDCGWNLHDTMIWEKPCFSMPSTSRYHQMFEYMFVFSKGKPKTFNPFIDRPNKYAGKTALGENSIRQKDGSMKPMRNKVEYADFGMRGNIWRLHTASSERPCKKLEHPAMFSENLAKDQILSWSNEEDLVYDPFAGGGTTVKVARDLDRNFIGSEISEDYCNLIEKRLDSIR